VEACIKTEASLQAFRLQRFPRWVDSYSKTISFSSTKWLLLGQVPTVESVKKIENTNQPKQLNPQTKSGNKW